MGPKTDDKAGADDFLTGFARLNIDGFSTEFRILQPLLSRVHRQLYPFRPVNSLTQRSIVVYEQLDSSFRV